MQTHRRSCPRGEKETAASCWAEQRLQLHSPPLSLLLSSLSLFPSLVSMLDYSVVSRSRMSGGGSYRVQASAPAAAAASSGPSTALSDVGGAELEAWPQRMPDLGARGNGFYLASLNQYQVVSDRTADRHNTETRNEAAAEKQQSSSGRPALPSQFVLSPAPLTLCCLFILLLFAQGWAVTVRVFAKVRCLAVVQLVVGRAGSSALCARPPHLFVRPRLSLCCYSLSRAPFASTTTSAAVVKWRR